MAATAPPAREARTVGPFELRDAFGNVHSWESITAKNSFIAVVFFGCECPLVRLYAPRLQEIADAYADRGVLLLAIDSNEQDSLEDIADFARVEETRFPILKDPGAKVADNFNATRTPEAFLLDRKGRVLYQGRIDDQYGVGTRGPRINHAYLRDAIEAALADRVIEVTEQKAVGCLIGRVPAKESEGSITYASHVAAILHKRCVECHREGEISPFPLTDLEEIRGWAPMIREVVAQGRMPPWGATDGLHHFSNDPSLSEEEKETLFRWIDDNCPSGDLAKAPPLPSFPTGWRIPTPDEVYYIADEPVPIEANGPLPYKTFIVPLPLREDMWIKAAEIRPGNRKVVHHVSVWILPPDVADDDFSQVPNFPYAPGTPPLTFPEGFAVNVPRGSRLRIQIHYEPIGIETTDRTYVGFCYMPADQVRGQVAYDSVYPIQPFEIAPKAASALVGGRAYFAREARLLALLPHLHLRGTGFRYFLKPPGGEWQTLLDVPRYDFSWQLVYFFDKPLDIPAGSEIYCEGVYDNSSQNRNNPDPSARVTWGPETTSEMLVGYLIAIDPASVGKDADKYRFPLEAFGAPMKRDWEIAGGSARANLQQSADAEGEVRLTIQGDDQSKGGVAIRRPIVPLKKGATYKIAFEARAGEPRSVRVRAESGERQALGEEKSFEIGPEWKRHDFFFEATGDSTDALVVFDVGPSEGSVELRATVVLQGAHR